MRSKWLLLFGLASQTAFASFDFNPITASLAPSGPRSNASFTVSNDMATKTPIQISIVHRDPTPDGKETHKETPDIDNLFQIFPAQIVLNPKEKRTVRVTYIGPPKLDRELAFRIIAEELPFSLEDPNKSYSKPVGSIRLSSRYIGGLYVTPSGAQSQLVVRGLASDDKPAKLQVEIENKGTEHHLLSTVKMKIAGSNKGSEVELAADQLAQIQGENILAGKMRRFKLPWPSSIPVGPVKVELVLPKQ